MESPAPRHTIPEAANLLRMSKALLYQRISNGEIRLHKDGRRSYISADELKRYADAKATAHAA